jgi:osmotically-inducible protein OsmY
MNQYPQNPQQFGGPYQQGNPRQQRGDDYQAHTRPWQEDSWSGREQQRDYEQQQRGRDYGGSQQGGSWQQSRGSQQEGYRGGEYANAGGMGRWPRNEDRENYGAQQDYSFANPGYGSDEYRRFENPGRNYGSQQPYYETGGQSTGGAQYWGGRQNYGQGVYGQGTQGSQAGGYTPQEYSGAGNWSGAASSSGRYQPQQNFGPQQSFRGRSPKGYARSDERIKEDICERLTEDPNIDASEISIEVQGGIVTLEGTVEDRMQKHRAEDMVDACSGVKDVHNRLTVSRRTDSQGIGGQSAGGTAGQQSKSTTRKQ